ncbi:MAG TPA: TolC family outer membrane protein [Solimonas sp.]|nr:TolC family outer membrane protein [Solimonas sp.]
MSKKTSAPVRRRMLLGAVLALGLPSLAQAQASADLLTVYSDALAHNPQYRTMAAQYRATQEMVPASFGKLLPQLGLRARYEHIWEDIDGQYYAVQDLHFDDDYDHHTYGAQLQQVIFNGSLLAGWDAAKLRVTQAGFALEGSQDELGVNVVESYFAVLGAIEGLRYADAETESLRQESAQAASRADAGLALEADKQVALATYELALARQAEARSLVDSTRLRLETLTGRSYGPLKLLPAQVSLNLPPLDEKAWIERARTHNAGVLARTAALQAAQKEMKQAQRGRWPTLNAQGLAYWDDHGGGVVGDREEEEQRIGVTLDLPLYSGGQISAQIDAAKARADAAQAQLDEARAQAIRDTRQAYLQITTGLLKAQGLKRAVEAAIAAEQATRSAAEAGTRTNADLLQAIDTRYDAERNYAVLRYRLLLNGVQLRAASGTLVTADLINLNRLLVGATPAP